MMTLNTMTSGKKLGKLCQRSQRNRFPLDPPLSDAGLEQAQTPCLRSHGGCMVGTKKSGLGCKLLWNPYFIVWLLVVLYLIWNIKLIKHQHFRTCCSIFQWLSFVLVSSIGEILYIDICIDFVRYEFRIAFRARSKVYISIVLSHPPRCFKVSQLDVFGGEP